MRGTKLQDTRGVRKKANSVFRDRSPLCGAHRARSLVVRRVYLFAPCQIYSPSGSGGFLVCFVYIMYHGSLAGRNKRHSGKGATRMAEVRAGLQDVVVATSQICSI